MSLDIENDTISYKKGEKGEESKIRLIFSLIVLSFIFCYYSLSYFKSSFSNDRFV